jgi:hypothetical protein
VVAVVAKVMAGAAMAMAEVVMEKVEAVLATAMAAAVVMAPTGNRPELRLGG